MRTEPAHIWVISPDEAFRAPIPRHLKKDLFCEVEEYGEELTLPVSQATAPPSLVMIDSCLEDWQQRYARLRESYPGLRGVLLKRKNDREDARIQEENPDLKIVIWPAASPDELLASVKQQLARQEEKAIQITLASLTHNISSARSMEQVMQVTCRAVVELFRVDHSGFVEFDDDGSHGWAKQEFPLLSSTGTLIMVNNEAEDQVVKQGRIFESRDVLHDERFGEVQRKLLDKKIQSILIVPVRVGDRVCASFSLDAIRSRRDFTPDEIELAEMIAGQVGIAIESMRTKEEVAFLRQAAQAVQEVSRRSARGNLEETLQCIVDLVVENLKADIGTLYTYDRDTHRFILSVGRGHGPDTLVKPENIGRVSTLYRLLDTESPYEKTEDAQDHEIFKGGFVTKENVRSSFGMKLMTDDGPVGVLFINFRGPRAHHFRDEEIQTYIEFGNQAAVIIRNFQLRQASTKRLMALEGLYGLDDALTKNDLESALKRIVDQAPAVVTMTGLKEGGIVHIAVRQGNRIRFRVASDLEVRDRLNQTFQDIELSPTAERIGIVGRAMLDDRTINVGDVKHDPEYSRFNIPYDERINSQLTVPLHQSGHVFGALTVESHQASAFNEEARRNLEHLAQHAELIIQNSRQLMLVKMLLELGQNLTSSTRLADALKRMADMLREFFDCDIASIFTLSPSHTDTLASPLLSYPAAVSGLLREGRHKLYDPKLVEEFGDRIPLDQFRENSVVCRLYEHGQPVYTGEGQPASDHFILGAGEFAKRQGVLSSAGVPLYIKLHDSEQVAGFLFLNYRQPHVFSEQEQTEIQVLGAYIARAIEHYRQYDELLDEKWNVGGVNIIAWIDDYSRKWETLARNAAMNIRSKLHLLEQQLGDLSPEGKALTPEVREILSAIRESASQISRNSRSPRPRWQEARYMERDCRVDLVLKTLLRRYRQDKNMRIPALRSQAPLEARTIRADREWLQYGFENLFNYLIESSTEANAGKLEVELDSDESQLWLTIACAGLKHAPCQKSIQSLSKSDEEDGLRFKLQAAHAILALYGGRINCHQEDGTGRIIIEIIFPRTAANQAA